MIYSNWTRLLLTSVLAEVDDELRQTMESLLRQIVALLKTFLLCVSQNHKVMGKCPKQDFVVLGAVVACGECRAETSLVAGKAAFGLCPVTILPRRKAVIHSLAIPSFWRAVGAARIDGNHGASDAKLDAAQHMIMFRIIGLVRQNPSRPQRGGCLSHGRDKSRGILAGTKTDNGSYDQLGYRMENSG